MNISIFGLGYVGCVSMGCLTRRGHKVVGVDVSPRKVDLVNQGQATIVEEHIGELIAEQYKAGRLRATISAGEAVQDSMLSFVCVGTPTGPHGHLNVEYIYHVAEQIGEALTSKDSFHCIAIRSTVPPGTTEAFATIVERMSGKVHGTDFGVVCHPEFLREGSGVKDFDNPPLVAFGSVCSDAVTVLRELYSDMTCPIYETTVGVAEMLKFANNSFHALKIVFANEIGRICDPLNVDAHELMRLICADTQLNISPAYLKPGFAFGGSCLPKDLKAICMLAHDKYVQAPVLEAINESNEEQKTAAIKRIETSGAKRIALLGLGFKPGTDDLRNSPAVDLAEQLLGKGYKLTIYDKNVVLSNLTGRNRDYIQAKLPHIGELLVDAAAAALNNADVAVLATADPELMSTVEQIRRIPVIDLTGKPTPRSHEQANG
ncbi:MAG: nucleotide sugar dehydrogenase [Candidatus Pacebacteria bacterium]|nr:nucleotide sugar dehydrogenase [Candidatus Paceibacterota bacterium]